MNLHRYKARIPSISSGDSHYEFLGTWIGFAGLITYIFDTAFLSSARDAAGPAAIIVGVLSFSYWLSTQHHKLIYVMLGVLSLFVAAMMTVIGIGVFVYSQTIPILNLYLVYLSSTSIVTGYYAKRMFL